MYRKCEWCGAILDPGEICDCKENPPPDDEDPEAEKGNILHAYYSVERTESQWYGIKKTEI